MRERICEAGETSTQHKAHASLAMVPTSRPSYGVTDALQGDR